MICITALASACMYPVYELFLLLRLPEPVAHISSGHMCSHRRRNVHPKTSPTTTRSIPTTASPESRRFRVHSINPTRSNQMSSSKAALLVAAILGGSLTVCDGFAASTALPTAARRAAVSLRSPLSQLKCSGVAADGDGQVVPFARRDALGLAAGALLSLSSQPARAYDFKAVSDGACSYSVPLQWEVRVSSPLFTSPCPISLELCFLPAMHLHPTSHTQTHKTTRRISRISDPIPRAGIHTERVPACDPESGPPQEGMGLTSKTFKDPVSGQVVDDISVTVIKGEKEVTSIKDLGKIE